MYSKTSRKFIHLIKCIVPNCPGKNSAQIRLFKIPESEVDLWCENLKISVNSIRTTARVCSRHFEPLLIGSKKLKQGAMPTLELGHTGSEICNCCIIGCKTTSPPSVLFRFPENKIYRDTWLRNCTIKNKFKESVQKFICKLHFESHMVINDKLTQNAIPTKAMQVNEDLSEEVAENNVPKFGSNCCKSGTFYKLKYFQEKAAVAKMVNMHNIEKLNLENEIEDLQAQIELLNNEYILGV